ncbi:CDP-glycerol glycerophosphotransferase family protein [Rhizohabitans arisaemae]|uniref:CDP-glycerol glycerophosphotransferase family protein n=1 Tax=Rhizohabitans arisaemae TaxID=2720610 RepID=UPI0024B114B8|nr:CDP-glycerol glycerophosphotransferase family protein [Rhizohabitans arisaemae]
MPSDALRELQAICDREESVAGVAAAVTAAAERAGRPRDRRSFDLGVLGEILPRHVEHAVEGGVERCRELIVLLRPYLLTVSAPVKRELPTLARLKYHLIEQDMAERLAGLAGFTGPAARVRKRMRWYARLPYLGELPDHVYRLSPAELTPATRVDEIDWRDGRLRIAGWAYLPRMSIRTARFQRATVVLRGPRGTPAVRLRARRTHRPEATRAAGHQGCNYDWSGFVAELDPSALTWRAALHRALHRALGLLRARRRGSPDVTWRAEIRIWSRGATGSALLGGPAAGRVQRPKGREAAPGQWIRPVWSGGKLRIVSRMTGAVLERSDVKDGLLHLSGLLPGPAAPTGRLRLGSGDSALLLPAEFTSAEGGTAFTASFPVPERAGEWRLWAEPKGHAAVAVHLIGPSEAADRRFSVDDDRELSVTRDFQDRVVVGVHPYRASLGGAHWGDGASGELVLSGSCAAPGARRLVLRHPSGLLQAFPVERAGNRFEVRFAPTRTPLFGTPVPLASGTWELEIGGEPVRYDHRAIDDLTEAPVVVDGRRHTLRVKGADTAVLTVAEEKPDEERDKAGRRALLEEFYPEWRERPLRDAVAYVCWNGQQYSDSVRAVYEELVRRDIPLEHLWIVKDGAFTPPGPAELGGAAGHRLVVVRAGSREHYAAMATSRYVVANTYLPKWVRIREDQLCVQTWHGTPLKRIGNDMPAMSGEPKPEFWHRQRAEVVNWDLLVSQTPWASPILARAFGYEGPILECGYPRNDLLFRDRDGSLKARIRERLGVPDGKRVVLYAPTWRDSGETLDLRFDVADARRVLGDCVMLVRGHLMQRRPGLDDPTGLLLDVTTYPDIGDLLLVADALVTDYSSVMFDFASTDRPMVFFTYDFERYRTGKRGFYFDFEAEAPGPLTSTSDELLAALRNCLDSPDAFSISFAGRRIAFREKYCPFDDGQAATRLVNHIWDPST